MIEANKRLVMVGACMGIIGGILGASLAEMESSQKDVTAENYVVTVADMKGVMDVATRTLKITARLMQEEHDKRVMFEKNNVCLIDRNNILLEPTK